MDRPGRSKKGKVALVTGAARGLGLAFVQRLAAEGATVIAVDRDEAASLAEQLIQLGASDAFFHRADVSDERDIEELAAAVLARHGCCDIVVNNAGINPNAPLSEISFSDWRRVMAVNVDSMFLVCRAFVPAMAERNYGRIVNITSDTLGSVVNGFCHYMASKGAVVGFTRALANEFGTRGVTANCIAPGLTRTPSTEKAMPDGKMFEMLAGAQAIKRQAVPEDLVGAMSFLTSDDASFVTGQTLIVDGGLLKAI